MPSGDDSFKLGKTRQNTKPTQKSRTVTLRKLVDGSEQNEDKIRQFHLDIIQKERTKRRNEQIAKKRQVGKAADSEPVGESEGEMEKEEEKENGLTIV